MNIVVLDGFTLNPGDLSWKELESLGACRIHDRVAPDEVLSAAASAGILLTNKVLVSREHIQKLPSLKYICVMATGTNVVDLAAERERNIPVSNIPAYSTFSVAQTTFALLLELTHRVGHHGQTVREGRWSRSADWSYWDTPLVELAGLNFGIVGFGRIGRVVAGIAVAFGMKVLVHSRTPPPISSGARFVDLETLLRESDVVSLHCPLTPETKHLVDARRLSLMKPTAFLLNTSRGPLVDEEALAAALDSGRLAGAGLDVLSGEPPREDNPLVNARNCIVTPHIGWATHAARARLMKAVVENVRAFIAGKPINVVN